MNRDTGEGRPTIGPSRGRGAGGAPPVFTATLPLQVSTSDVRYRYSVFNYGAVGDGVANDTAAFTAALAAANAAGGGAVVAPAGSYRVKPGVITFAGLTGVRLVGDGHGTKVVIDDTLGNAGGVGIDLGGSYQCSLFMFTVDAPAKRTAGIAVRVRNGLQDFGGALFCDSHVDYVNFNNQFDGYVVDDTLAAGNWLNYLNRSFFTNTKAGGTCVRIATVHGGSNYISDVWVRGLAANLPAAAIQITGTGDFTLTKVSTTLCDYGLRINPSVAGDAGHPTVQAGEISDCFFDTNTFNGVSIETSGAGTVGRLQFDNIWSAGNLTNFYLVGAIDRCTFIGCTSLTCTYGFQVGGTATNIGIFNSNLQSAFTANVYLTGTSSNIKVNDNVMGNSPGAGIKIDAAVQKYDYNDNDMGGCTIKVIDAGHSSVCLAPVFKTGTGALVPDAAVAKLSYAADPGADLAVANTPTPNRYPINMRLLRRFLVEVLTTPTHTPYTVTVYKNGAPTTMAVTVPAGTAPGTMIFDDSSVFATHIQLFGYGDVIDVRADTIASAADAGEVRKFSYCLESINGIWQ
jgi:hypothetical protein